MLNDAQGQSWPDLVDLSVDFLWLLFLCKFTEGP